MPASMTRMDTVLRCTECREALAAALRDAYRYSGSMNPDFHAAYVKAVAFECARFNPNFDRARFLAACGVQEN